MIGYRTFIGMTVAALLLLAGWVLADTPHHYLCRVKVSDSGLELLSARRIDAPMPQLRGERKAAALQVRFIAPDGHVLHESRHSDPRLLRAAFSPEQSDRTHVAIPRGEGVLLLRLPQAPRDSRLVVSVRQPNEITLKSQELALGELRLDLAAQAEVPR
jgi:hypothetical protein